MGEASYTTVSLYYRLVDETLQRVEREQEAMEAVLVHMSENGVKESSPDHLNVWMSIRIPHIC